MSNQTPIRVRFAPSPTGNLHIGGARTAIYNWAFAHANEGTFVLRIEDTDPLRSSAENTAQIIRSLRWLGLNWDEGPETGGELGPYLQTERFDTYDKALARLQERGNAYPCFCAPEELHNKREAALAAKQNPVYDRCCRDIDPDEAQQRIVAGEPHTWRLKIPLDRGAISFDDTVYGTVTVPLEQLDDFILVRSDGKPTYNFVVCVDDALMQISHVIRGDDHLSNTPKQILVYEALGYPTPQFAHLSMILGSDGKRLSKRHGATSVEAYQEAGYLPEALVNYLALLGWSLDGETTIIDADTLKTQFSLDRISKSPAVFDEKKLDWVNQSYLKELGSAGFVDAWLPYLEADGLATAAKVAEKRSWFEDIYPLVVERVHTLSEINPLVNYLFGETVSLDEKSVEKCLAGEGTGELLESITALLQDENLKWEHEALDTALRGLAEQRDIKPKIVFQALRVATSGNMVSPPLLESLELLGREVTLARLEAAKPFAG
ncbi:MAG: glutamate--tRNA ligase [Coriobacteriia bacterium]|nr:glutamate--tRNA ligase [Coriobacteriia bacterium]